jgi:hypothetical protein
VNVIDAPQNISCKHHGVSLIPSAIYRVYKIIHQGADAVMCWRPVRPDRNLTRPIFPRVRVQTGDGVKIEGLDHMLWQKRLPHIEGSLSYRAQKIVLSVAVGYL